LGNLSTPNSVQKLQTASHAKAKVEVDYHFYARYDKISPVVTPTMGLPDGPGQAGR
jgi:hypothetical protein